MLRRATSIVKNRLLRLSPLWVLLVTVSMLKTPDGLPHVMSPSYERTPTDEIAPAGIHLVVNHETTVTPEAVT